MEFGHIAVPLKLSILNWMSKNTVRILDRERIKHKIIRFKFDL